MISRLNGFLAAIGSQARFDLTIGKFSRDGFEIEAPGPLSSLPKLAELETDVPGMISNGDLFGCLLLDLDNFKAVNDRNGHLAGDACLDAVSQAIGGVITRKGKLYRFRQGDEFAVVLRNFSASEAAATAERIRQQVEGEKPGGDVPVTASIGVLTSPEAKVDTSAKFLDLADEMMYLSKFEGKNRVTVYPVPEERLEVARAARAKAKGRG